MNNYYNPYQFQQQNQTKNGIIWVQGIEGAKAYQLMPNSNTVLLDSENDGVFYIKVSDNVGMCTLRTFKYTEIQETPTKQANLDNYVTREEFDKKFEELKGLMGNEQTVQPAKRRTITE